MKQKFHSLWFFLCTFLISVFIMVSFCLVAGLDMKNGGFEVDFDRFSVTALGSVYTLDEDFASAASTLLDFNGTFFGSHAARSIKQGIITLCHLFIDFFRFIFFAVNAFINNSVM